MTLPRLTLDPAGARLSLVAFEDDDDASPAIASVALTGPDRVSFLTWPEVLALDAWTSALVAGAGGRRARRGDVVVIDADSSATRASVDALRGYLKSLEDDLGIRFVVIHGARSIDVAGPSTAS